MFFEEDDPRQQIIDEILALEFENLFDYKESRAKEIQTLREKIDYYQPLLPIE